MVGGRREEEEEEEEEKAEEEEKEEEEKMTENIPKARVIQLINPASQVNKQPTNQSN